MYDSRIFRPLLLVLLLVSLAHTARAADHPYSRSWIHIDPASNSRILASGDAWEVPVEYYLDPADAPLAGQLLISVMGPWMDGPDGVYVKERHHENYPGMSQAAAVQSGRHKHVFRFTVPPAKPQGNSLLIITRFTGKEGDWPWEVRLGGIWFHRTNGFFELETAKAGNLFTYDQPVEFSARLISSADAGTPKTLNYKVFDATKELVATGSVQFTAGREGERISLPLKVDRRGILLMEAEVDGWEKRQVTFGRIPDLIAITNAGRDRTKFGLHEILNPQPQERVEEQLQIARALGLSAVRTMVSWKLINPGPDVFALEAWDMPLDLAKKHHVDPYFMIDNPPAWMLTSPPKDIHYMAFGFDEQGLRQFVQKATTHYKGRLYAWEWLNEIVPGDDNDAAQHYLDFCRIATETAKAADPKVLTTLAGGLWPRNFRTALLAAGVAKYVDVLPIHYSDGAGVRQARADLQAVGAPLAIWDNESAACVNVWNVPKLEELANRMQSQYLLTRWTDELSAGCDRIFWFGGQGDPAGNWSYLLDDLSPRPVAATMAVFASKMHNAQALGAFSLGQGSKLHLFYRQGQCTLVAWAPSGASVSLPAGAGRLTVTDHQGNESPLATTDGAAQIELTPMPVFIDGLDPEVIRALVMTTIVGNDDPTQPARLTLLTGKEATLQARLSNPYAASLKGQLQLQTPQGWPAVEPAEFDVAPGESRIIALPIRTPPDAKPAALAMTLAVSTGTDRPTVEIPIQASVVSPQMMGNLLPNGDFETATPDNPNRPAIWGIGEHTEWALSEGLGEGLGQRILKFTNTNDAYASTPNRVQIPGGQTYLYTAWVWTQDMQGGSNIDQQFADGSARSLYNVQVFVTPPSTPSWQLFTSRYEAPDNLAAVSFTPVVKGSGHALFDNLRVTRYEGTDFMAEAYRTTTAPAIDGKLDDWQKRCPIPLLGTNQLTLLDTAYAWSPQNLSSVAYLAWDDQNLYVAMRVQDDVHSSTTTGEDAVKGDSLLVAFDPTARATAAETASFAYHIASASPGGGSGKHTLYRPQGRSGGLSSGHLLKDSSVYDLAIGHENGVTTYEVRIPWSELGGITPGAGSRFGFSMQLNDNDGKGPAAQMTWGHGLSPAWHPGDFGMVTLLE